MGRTIVCIIAALLPVVLEAQQPDRARTDALARQVDERMRTLRGDADRLAGRARSLLGDLRELETQRDLERATVKQADADLAAVRETLRQTLVRLTTIEQERIKQTPDIGARLVELYKHGRSGYLALLMNARDPRDLGRATRAVASLAHLNQLRIAEHQRTLASLEQERASLVQRVAQLQSAQSGAQRARAAAERTVAAREALIADIDRQRDLNAQLAGELAVARQKLAGAIANLRSGRPADPVTIPLAAFRGALEWPVAGTVTGRFGRPSPRAADGAARTGIEIAASEGTAVHAVSGGVVSYAEVFTGYGTLVIVDHGPNHASLYGYLGSASVKRDQRVEAGDDLGRVGLAPAGPAALYFELRADSRPVDPLQWLRPR